MIITILPYILQKHSSTWLLVPPYCSKVL